MYDFLGFRIHFKDAYTTCTQVGEEYQFSIDMSDLPKRGLRLEGSIDANEDGIAEVSNVRHPWDSIPSSYTGIAFKVFQASGFRTEACVELKASPAKVMQGHNVFGSDCLYSCSTFILKALKDALPQFSNMLDFSRIEVFRFDTTYSIQLDSPDVLQSALDSLTKVSHRYLRPSRQGEFESTVYFNNAKNNPNTGRTTSLCIYSKLDEVQHQIDDLKKKKKRERTEVYDRVINQLESPELQDFAQCRLRFESRFKTRWFEKNDIPRDLWELIKYVEEYEKQHSLSFCLFAWHDAMKDLLSAVQNSTISVVHDNKIMSLLHNEYDTIDAKGTLRKSKALRLFALYDRLKHSTYEQVKNTMAKSTFYDGVRDLTAIGLSKSQLQNLHNTEQLPLAQVFTFDFENQRPASYQEPDLGDLDTPEKLLAWLSDEEYVEAPVTELDTIRDSLESNKLPSLYARSLQAGREVRLNQDTAMSFVLFADGTSELVFHAPNDKHARTQYNPIE
ncbi:phage/plasmid replication protein, II/X family [Photobacterium sp. ZSDE20]|nr:phage/plasmid replication protein, II/X family [Photobacterium sp. ZSDE20]